MIYYVSLFCVICCATFVFLICMLLATFLTALWRLCVCFGCCTVLCDVHGICLSRVSKAYHDLYLECTGASLVKKWKKRKNTNFFTKRTTYKQINITLLLLKKMRCLPCHGWIILIWSHTVSSWHLHLLKDSLNISTCLWLRRINYIRTNVKYPSTRL